MKTPALFATDLHGNRFAYERLFGLAERENIKYVFLGGDLAPKWEFLNFYNTALLPLQSKWYKQDADDALEFTYLKYLTDARERSERKVTKAREYYMNYGGIERYIAIRLNLEQVITLERVLVDLLSGHEKIASEDLTTLAAMMQDEDADAQFSLLPEDQAKIILTAIKQIHDSRNKILRTHTGVILDLLGRYCPSYQSIPKRLYPSEFVNVLKRNPAREWLKYASESTSYDRIAKAQSMFFRNYFKKSLKNYLEKVRDGHVYAILGNDDMLECEEDMLRLETQGLLTYLNKKTVELYPGRFVAGYPYVHLGGNFYPGWDISEAEMLEGLTKLERAADPAKTLFVIHQPPFNSRLDESFGGEHFGSSGISDWLTSSKKLAVLSGHVHEAPFVNGGFWQQSVSGTPCFQPGGWHEEGLCAIQFDLEHVESARWINNQTK
ncbi:MAG: hypothetical protein WCJ29_06485 [bacterium]